RGFSEGCLVITISTLTATTRTRPPSRWKASLPRSASGQDTGTTSMVKWASCDTGARRVTEVVWSGCPVARFGRIVGSKDLAGGDPVHSLESPLIARGTHDGTGAGDHDQPYRFGRRPRATATYPFST